MEDAILSVICNLIFTHLGLTMVFKEDLWIKSSVYLPICSNMLGHSSQCLYWYSQNCYLANIARKFSRETRKKSECPIPNEKHCKHRDECPSTLFEYMYRYTDALIQRSSLNTIVRPR